jgi:threonine dehydratase
VTSGGNIDVTTISQIISRGLNATGRYASIEITLKDRPGSLTKLTSLLSSLEANIVDIVHVRNDISLPIGFTKVNISLETKSLSHVIDIFKRLELEGYAAIKMS